MRDVTLTSLRHPNSMYILKSLLPSYLLSASSLFLTLHASVISLSSVLQRVKATNICEHLFWTKTVPSTFCSAWPWRELFLKRSPSLASVTSLFWLSSWIYALWSLLCSAYQFNVGGLQGPILGPRSSPYAHFLDYCVLVL